MTRHVAGLDGCPDGWVVVTEDGDGVLSTRVACSFADALWHLPDDAIVAVDTPIGLTDAGQRECDRAARKLLRWPRRCSVFSSPVRGVLGIRDYRTASDTHRSIDGRGMSKQSFAIMDKIEEVDDVLRSGPDSLRERVVEVHPEVTFCVWNGDKSMEYSKRTSAGRVERRRLIEAAWPGALDGLEHELDATGARCGVDDLYDALAAVWTAGRVREDDKREFPDQPACDTFGLRMAIVG